jgi:pyrophosphatase PpaX
MKRPAGIVFDVDGTLIDTYRLYLEAYRRSIAEHIGHTPTDEEIVLRLGEPSGERRFLEDWVGADRAAACHASLCEHYRSLHTTWCDGLYDGVREMLGGLRSAGLPLAVVTGKGRKAWEITSEFIDLGSFDTVITEDEMQAPKPDPGGLLAAAAAMELQPADLVYVGDSLADMGAARAAGMLSAAVLWPKTDPVDRAGYLLSLDPGSPDWIFERPADLVRTFAPWC